MELLKEMDSLDFANSNMWKSGWFHHRPLLVSTICVFRKWLAYCLAYKLQMLFDITYWIWKLIGVERTGQSSWVERLRVKFFSSISATKAHIWGSPSILMDRFSLCKINSLCRWSMVRAGNPSTGIFTAHHKSSWTKRRDERNRNSTTQIQEFHAGIMNG